MSKTQSFLFFLPVLGLLACAPGSVVMVVPKEPSSPRIGMKAPEEELKEIIAQIERGELPKIQFEFDSAEILLSSNPTLDAIVDLLLRNPQVKLLIYAHTDAVGTEEYNLDLSSRRARSVKRYLAGKGVPPPSMRSRGLGFSQPIADNSTDEGRAKNRRVEFRVTFRDWDSVY